VSGNGAKTQQWRERVVDRSLGKATQRSIDRSAELIFAAATLLERSNGDTFTVQDVADTAKQSLRTLYAHFDGKDDLLLAVFEEAMQAYARLLAAAIEVYDEPLERLAAAVYFATRLWERATRGANVGFSRLRGTLIESAPEKLAAAQAPVVELMSGLVEDASAAGAIAAPSKNAATYLVLAMLSVIGHSHVLGNEYGIELPDSVQVVEFALHGLGAELPAGWSQRFEERWTSMPTAFSVSADIKPSSKGR
jgi:AcrR family transcriptional regulator